MTEAANSLVDSHGRAQRYLRISVTPSCDIRCTYCTPDEGVPFPQARPLSVAAIERITRVAASMGVHRVRLTGGEPLMRRELPEILEAVASVAGIERVALTTNGQRLALHAKRLAAAGLEGVNISVDSLEEARYARLTRGGQLHRTLRGIDAALDAGLRVKINAVALSDLMWSESQALVERWAPSLPVEVRFLEVMPLSGSGWSSRDFVSLASMQADLIRHYGLQRLPTGDGVAQRFGRPDWLGAVGFVRSLSSPFCDACSRLRVTAWGELRPCLFSPISVDLRPFLDDEEALRAAFEEATRAKPAGHGLDAATWQSHAKRRLTWIRHTGG